MNRRQFDTKADIKFSKLLPLYDYYHLGYENCSRSLEKIKLENPVAKMSIFRDENDSIILAKCKINGRRLNYAEGMVLIAMSKNPTAKHRYSL